MLSNQTGTEEQITTMTKSVLLAEDEPNIVESISFLLKREGFEVMVTGDGRTALETAIAEKPDVMVLDLMLPEMDGYEVLRNLRANQEVKNLPVLMLTAKGQKIDRETALECGADLFMTKPFSNADIIAAVNSLVSDES